MATNEEAPFGRNTWDAATNTRQTTKPSAASTLLPVVQKYEQQKLQQLKKNVTTEIAQENDNLIDVITATMTTAIKSNSIQTQDLSWSTAATTKTTTKIKTTGLNTPTTLEFRISTADDWNGVNSRRKANRQT